MARQVTIAAGKSNVLLPDGGTYNAGDVVILTDAQFSQLRQALIPATVIDDGVVEGVEDQVVTQSANIAAIGALTSTAPAALTAVAAAGAAPTDAEFDALLADVTALRTTLAATQADVATVRTKVNAILTALTGSGLPIAAP